MEPITINPNYVHQVVNKNKPALITISKMNVTFNTKATKLLSMQKGTEFAFCIIDGKLSFKLATSDGFKISTINAKGCAQVFLPGILSAIKEHIKITTRSQKFEVGIFKEGMWPLIPTDGETAMVKSENVRP